MGMYFTEEELGKAKIMYEIVVERAHLKGKKHEEWTDEDKKRYVGELEHIPGKYRDIILFSAWGNNPKNLARAKELGIDVRELYRLAYTGLGGYTENHNKTETDMTEEPLPGYVYGFKMPDMVFRHT